MATETPTEETIIEGTGAATAANSQPSADAATETQYHFPTYGVVIEATSKEEADEKLQAQLNAK